MTPEEIVIDGEKFTSPDHVPAPEENVPGQILDSVSIKVFNKTNPGAAPLQHKGFIGDGIVRRFDIGLTVIESKAITVYVNKIKQEYIGDSTISYIIDFIENKIEFNVAPAMGSIIEIISVGIITPNYDSLHNKRITIINKKEYLHINYLLSKKKEVV
jgi:hypothetical protein